MELKMKEGLRFYLPVLIILLFFYLVPSDLRADNTTPVLSRGETVYVPVYSHIYTGNREQLYQLTVTLSVRNIDPNHSLTVTNVDYHETQGKILKKYLEKPLSLEPLGSTRFIVPLKDTKGGSGANFIVIWKSDRNMNQPIIESVMIGTQSQQGISFTSRGVNIKTSTD
jgi:hypothetical protein